VRIIIILGIMIIKSPKTIIKLIILVIMLFILSTFFSISIMDIPKFLKF